MKAAVSALAATLLAALVVGSASAAIAARSQGPNDPGRHRERLHPAQFRRTPKTGKGNRLEYDAVNETPVSASTRQSTGTPWPGTR